MGNWKDHFLGDYNGRRRVSSPELVPRPAAPEPSSQGTPDFQTNQAGSQPAQAEAAQVSVVASDPELDVGRIEYSPAFGAPPSRARATHSHFLFGLLAVLAAATTMVVFQRSQPVLANEEKPKLIAVRIQVRSSSEEARRYLEENYPALLHRFPGLTAVVEDWNSDRGLYDHGVTPSQLPFFIPEPREGLEKDFEELAGELVSGAIKLHVFEYQTEDFLYRVAEDCELDATPPESGLSWIHKWSTWRKDRDSPIESQCTSDGVCLLLTRGCKADTFDRF